MHTIKYQMKQQRRYVLKERIGLGSQLPHFLTVFTTRHYLTTSPIKGHKMTTQARRRLLRDFKRLQEDPPAGISGAPSQDNILKWQAVIFGYLFFSTTF
jgi:hypothetical protein